MLTRALDKREYEVDRLRRNCFWQAGATKGSISSRIVSIDNVKFVC